MLYGGVLVVVAGEGLPSIGAFKALTTSDTVHPCLRRRIVNSEKKIGLQSYTVMPHIPTASKLIKTTPPPLPPSSLARRDGGGGGRDRRGGDGRSPTEIHSLQNIKRLREIVRNIA